MIGRRQFTRQIARQLHTSARNSANQVSIPRWAYLACGLVILGAGVSFWSVNSSIVRSDATFASVFPVSEVMKHNTMDDCWIAIDGHVYDVSKFLAQHPGGAARILRFAGSDASSAFRSIHTELVLNRMKEHVTYLGPLGEGEFLNKAKKEQKLDVALGDKPSLAHIFNLLDFEFVAKKVLPQTTFTYYATGSSDEFSLRENRYAYLRVFFKPKALQNVQLVSTSTKMLGIDAELPLYISGFAGSCLAHPDAEWNLQRAAYKEKIVQMVPKQNSIDFDEFFDGVPADQEQWAQLHFYTDEELENMDEYINRFESRKNIKGIFFNVDVTALGNREKDSKVRALDEDLGEALNEMANNGGAEYCKTFTWDHVRKLVQKTNLPVGLKGIQRGEDVVLAAQNGIKAVILSNHGGRQLDFSRPPLEVLAEAKQMLKEKGLEKDIEIYVDGGIRRGSDIIKAICLGAKGVGMGRPFLYAMAGYGEAGVVRAIQILKMEMINNMRLLGARNIAELDESFIDASSLKLHNPNVNDRLYDENYVSLPSPPWGKA